MFHACTLDTATLRHLLELRRNDMPFENCQRFLDGNGILALERENLHFYVKVLLKAFLRQSLLVRV